MVSKGRRELQIGIVGRYRRKVGVEGRKRGRLVPKDERKAGNRMVGIAGWLVSKGGWELQTCIVVRLVSNER